MTEWEVITRLRRVIQKNVHLLLDCAPVKTGIKSGNDTEVGTTGDDVSYRIVSLRARCRRAKQSHRQHIKPLTIRPKTGNFG